jgi:hypothetical protein
LVRTVDTLGVNELGEDGLYTCHEGSVRKGCGQSIAIKDVLSNNLN